MSTGNHLLKRYGGAPRTFNAVLLWQVSLWRLWFDETSTFDKNLGGKGRPVDSTRIFDCIHPDLRAELGDDGISALTQEMLCRLREHQLVWETKTGQTIISLKALDPMRFVRSLFGDSMAEHELRYHVFASIRRRYRCTLSAETARLFHTVADGINRELIAPVRTSAGFAHRLEWNFKEDFVPALQRVVEPLGQTKSQRRTALQLFVAVARAVGYLQAAQRPGSIVCRTREVDAEYMTSSLFGLTTRIRGFDELFGGGLLLGEEPSFAEGDRIKGRIVLATGRFATGKSLLALQIAVEVAQKGGVAWILALEQSVEECLYTLQTMRVLPNDGSIAIARNTSSAFDLLHESDRQTHEAGKEEKSSSTPNRGALIFVKAEKTSYENFLEILHEPAEWMQRYPFRLIVVDPINAINKGSSPDLGKLRIETLRIFEKIKDSGTNVWLNAEDTLKNDESFFEQNIADTVIHLSAESAHGDIQRYIEVQKSRLQREQSGKHPFTIVTGSGIEIHPSSGAVSDRIRSRSALLPTRGTQFGLTTLDDVLGDDAIRFGDIIVLHGPPGCYKTQLGLRFLSHADPNQARSNTRGEPRNIVFVTGDSEISLRQSPYRRMKPRPDEIPYDICALPDGHVHPGQVLHAVEEELTRKRHQELTVDRVLFSNIVHWEMSCPFLREDEIFGNTLLELLRRQSVTSVLVCASPLNDKSHLQNAIIENADCVIEFHNTELQGRSQILLRVVKTHSMRQRRGWFELDGDSESVRVLPTPSLLRVASSGEVSQIPVRLFLHSETAMQSVYNKGIQRSLKAAVSRNVEIETPGRVFLDRVLGMSRFSVLDELQVVQFDEHELPIRSNNKSSLQLVEFPPELGDSEHWNDLLPRLRQRIRMDSNRIVAVPYFENISLLACDETIEEHLTTDWHSLAAECERFEASHSENLFFDFVKTSGENYNCLYMEILLALAGSPAPPSHCGFAAWFQTREAIESLVLFWRLCRRAHYVQAPHGSRSMIMRVNPKAKVWRHWYTTLNQMLSDMTTADRVRLSVRALPGEITIGGEWYLTVPAHSAAPELAIAMVRDLTKWDAELERLRFGVGLPTRSSYYSFANESVDLSTPASPYFSIRIGLLNKLVNTAFKRSTFACYNQFSSVLTSHLLRVLEMRSFVPSDAQDICSSLVLRLQTGGQSSQCEVCSMKTSTTST